MTLCKPFPRAHRDVTGLTDKRREQDNPWGWNEEVKAMTHNDDDDDLTFEEGYYEWTKKLRKVRPEKRLGSDQYQQSKQYFSYSDVNDDGDDG